MEALPASNPLLSYDKAKATRLLVNSSASPACNLALMQHQHHPRLRQAQQDYRSRLRSGHHPRERRGTFAVRALGVWIAVAGGTWLVMAPPQQVATDAPQTLASAAPTSSTEQIERSVYYSGCREARAAGVAPIYAGQPGYRSGMDGDGDGIACEPPRY